MHSYSTSWEIMESNTKWIFSMGMSSKEYISILCLFYTYVFDCLLLNFSSFIILISMDAA